MNKQTIDQPRTELLASRPSKGEQVKGGAKDASKDGNQEFAAELSAAALVAPQAPLPQPTGKGFDTAAFDKAAAKESSLEGVKGLETKAFQVPEQSALNLKAATTSSTTGSPIAGLKQPWSAVRTGDLSRWVFEGHEDPASALLLGQNGIEASSEKKPEAASAEKRGEADTAQANQASVGAQTNAVAGEPSRQQDLNAPVAPESGLEAQLASMNGVMQGLTPEGAGRGAAQNLKGLGAQAKARLPGGTAQAGLSGGEFLSTLSAAKNGVETARLGQQGQQEGQSQGEGEGKGAGLNGKPSLKMIPGGAKNVKTEFDSAFGAATAHPAILNPAVQGQHGAGQSNAGAGVPEFAGHVTRGANAQDRLSSESLGNISTGIRNFSALGNGGGEMRIRLKPDNLGELHVRVVTDGRNVGLSIQASDEKAKKVIEESLTHLKDSMAAQNLSLGSIDLTVNQSQGGSFGDNSGNQAQTPNQNAFGDLMNGSGNRQQGEGRTWAGDDASGRGSSNSRNQRSGFAAQPTAAQAFGQSRSAFNAGSGRLDVTA